MLPEIVAVIESAGVVLAAHAGLAWSLGLDYDQQQAAAGTTAWPRAAIAIPESFFAARHRANDGVTLLSSGQERLLWADIIAADAGSENPLLDCLATARLAAAAWRLMRAWLLPLAAPEWRETEETLAFQRWARAFERRCRERNWVSAADLPDRDCDSPPPAIALVGFDQVTPQLHAWLDRMRTAGAKVIESASPQTPAQVEVVCADTQEAELAAAAAWARALLDAGEAGPIGVVVADLGACRPAADRAFLQALHPRRAPGDTAARAYRLSMGVSLAEHPVTAAALLLLELLSSGTRRIAMDDASAVLLSPFVHGADSTAGARAGQDAALRRAGRTYLALGELLLPEWLSSAAPYPVWAERCAQALAALGWPGERALSSDEHQTVDAWHALLDELAALDAVAPGPVDETTALEQLRALAAGRSFQPRARRVPAVHVLDLTQSAGYTFTHLWIVGLDDRALPAAAAPHPLLPLVLQRARGLPGADATLQLATARAAWERLRRSAATVVASYAQREGEQELRSSPLLGHAAMPLPIPAPPPAAPIAWERLHDDSAPPVPALRRKASSTMFTEQSQCAFRAFAHLRLRAHEIPAAVAGLTAAAHGTLLHDALRRLSAGDTPELAAADAVAAERLLDGRPALARIESVSLQRRLDEWIEVEQKRKTFQTVATEQTREVNFGGWQLRLRLDRVDELEGGSLLLLDYKSGDVKKTAWNVDRFIAPQLPLYLVTSDNTQRVSAIAFAQLVRGEMRLKAMVAVKGMLPYATVPTEGWDAQVQDWREKLLALAEAHATGWAAVAPLTPDVCTRCDLHGLCRIAERDPAAAYAEEAEDDHE